MGREGVSFCSLFKAAELFEPRQGNSEVLSPAGKARIDSAILELGERVLSRAIVIKGYAVSEPSGDDLTLSRSRACLVRSYLHARFQLETQNIGRSRCGGGRPRQRARIAGTQFAW